VDEHDAASMNYYYKHTLFRYLALTCSYHSGACYFIEYLYFNHDSSGL